jgi:hypothetical protein
MFDCRIDDKQRPSHVFHENPFEPNNNESWTSHTDDVLESVHQSTLVFTENELQIKRDRRPSSMSGVVESKTNGMRISAVPFHSRNINDGIEQ